MVSQQDAGERGQDESDCAEDLEQADRSYGPPFENFSVQVADSMNLFVCAALPQPASRLAAAARAAVDGRRRSEAISRSGLQERKNHLGGGNAEALRSAFNGMNVREIPFKTMEGTETSLSEFEGSAVLVVNVASRCGLAPQYETLEKLQRRYGDRGLQVVGFPSNQFLQELRTNDAVKEYCSTTWGITFPIFDRVRVNGRHEHPLYTELKKTPDGNGKAGKVQWNFEKFLVTPEGEVHRFRPHVVPDDPMVIAAIEASLPS